LTQQLLLTETKQKAVHTAYGLPCGSSQVCYILDIFPDADLL